MPTSNVHELSLLPRDDALDPTALDSVGTWIERARPHHKSRRKVGPKARSVASLIHRMWPGIHQDPRPRQLVLRDPEAPFCAIVAEDRARVTVLAEPRDDEPFFARRIAAAICRQTGWIAYDSRQQDIVEGVCWTCATCDTSFPLQDSRCPTCRRPPSTDALTWSAPTSVFAGSPAGSLDLAGTLLLHDLSPAVLTDAVIDRLQAQLTAVVSDALDGRAAIEVSVNRETLGLEVFQCVEVVTEVTDPTRELPVDALRPVLDTEAGDELLFMLRIAHDHGPAWVQDPAVEDLLPISSHQPQLARPIGATLRRCLRQRAVSP